MDFVFLTQCFYFINSKHTILPSHFNISEVRMQLIYDCCQPGGRHDVIVSLARNLPVIPSGNCQPQSTDTNMLWKILSLGKEKLKFSIFAQKRIIKCGFST